MPPRSSIIVLQLLFDKPFPVNTTGGSGVCLGLVMQYGCRFTTRIEEVKWFTSFFSPGSRFAVTFIL